MSTTKAFRMKTKDFLSFIHSSLLFQNERKKKSAKWNFSCYKCPFRIFFGFQVCLPDKFRLVLPKFLVLPPDGVQCGSTCQQGRSWHIKNGRKSSLWAASENQPLPLDKLCSTRRLSTTNHVKTFIVYVLEIE